MKNLYPFYLLLIFQIFSQSNFAQEYKDCETAFNPCGESPFYINASMGVGPMESDLELTCVYAELNSTWITWTVIQGGALTFVLTPDTVSQDIDFVVFKFNADNDCEDKELIRCMASGENVGSPPSGWETCTGPTGLSIGETDIEELPGCSTNDNNFLAPLETNAGDHYVMLVNNFYDDIGQGFTLSFGGSAVLDCITVPTIEREDISLSSFEINPSLSTGILFIELANESLNNAELTIYNMIGQSVYSESSINQLSHQIDLTNLPQGSYVAVLRKDKVASTKRFFILK
ncbi:MAG: hypothetical protein ACI8X3_000557 [Saprospiraceae bacterium]|jgi:hypothetical protein